MLNRTRWLLGGLLCLALWPAATPAQTYRTPMPEEVSNVANGVRGALGIDMRRGDRVYITHLPFAGAQLRARAGRKRKQKERQELLTAVVLNIAKGIAVVLVLLVLRTVCRRHPPQRVPGGRSRHGGSAGA